MRALQPVQSAQKSMIQAKPLKPNPRAGFDWFYATKVRNILLNWLMISANPNYLRKEFNHGWVPVARVYLVIGLKFRVHGGVVRLQRGTLFKKTSDTTAKNSAGSCAP